MVEADHVGSIIMNDLERLHKHLLSYPETTEEFPFGPNAAVYKVAGKLFAILIPDELPARMNLKCDPDRAVDLRTGHEAIEPGYHMNKKHWNTLVLDGSLKEDFVEELVRHSFDLVVAGLKKDAREMVREQLSD